MSCGNCTDCSNKCDVCETCTGGTKKCNTQQTFCTGSTEEGQLASTYVGAANAPTITKDDIIIKVFPKAKFNELAAWVSTAAKYGNQKDSGAWGGVSASKDFLLASELNTLMAGIRSIDSNNPGADVAKDDPIKATPMNAIMTAINNLRLTTSACNVCNTACDSNAVSCETCDTCDSCIECDTCQSVSSYSSHYSSHYSSA